MYILVSSSFTHTSAGPTLASIVGLVAGVTISVGVLSNTYTPQVGAQAFCEPPPPGYVTGSYVWYCLVFFVSYSEHTNSISSLTPTNTERIFPTSTAVSTADPQTASIVGLVAGVTVSLGVLILGVIVVTVFIVCWKSQTGAMGRGTQCFTRKVKRDKETSPDRIKMSALPDDMSSTPSKKVIHDCT